MTELVFKREHAIEAIRQAKLNGRDWLYKKYPKPQGRSAKSRTGFLIHEGITYPVKPLGRLANILAGQPMIHNPITNEFRAHFVRLGFALVKNDTTQTAQEEAGEAVERQLRLATILSRPKQAQFRIAVFKHWKSRCLITGCRTVTSLEAAHIVPVADGGLDEAWNGLPLRADIHRLFDAGLIWIDTEALSIAVADDVISDYGEFKGLSLGSILTSVKEAAKTMQALRDRAELWKTD